MSTFLFFGSALGLVLGVLHAIQVYRSRAGAHPGDTLSAAYYAAWTVVLWALFGAYVLAFWLIGALGMGIARLRGAGAGP